MADAHNPGEELEDSKRAKLIQEIGTILGLKELDEVSCIFLWFSDLERLEEIRETLSKNPRNLGYWDMFRPGGSETLRNVLHAWLAKPGGLEPPRAKAAKRKAGDTPHTASANEKDEGSTKHRKINPKDPRLANLTLARDGERCVITKAADAVESCHIYPLAMGGKRGTDAGQTFWITLEQFWKAEEVKKWQDAVEGAPHGTEHLANRISLWSGVHDLWERALFVLKPIEQRDGPGLEQYLTVQFFWMPGVFSPRVSVRPSLSGDLQSTPLGTKLWNCETLTQIKSGHTIELSTENKLTHPLPSFELLQMQWLLQRIASLSGAAESLQDDDEDDDYNDESGRLTEGLLTSVTIPVLEGPPRSLGKPPSRGTSGDRTSRSPLRPLRQSSRSPAPGDDSPKSLSSRDTSRGRLHGSPAR